MATPSKITKFENAAASITYTFALMEYEYEDDQQLVAAPMVLIGTNYAYDGLGTGLARVGLARENLRFTVFATSGPEAVDTEIRAMRAAFRRIGAGKLWRQLASGALEWCWARADSVPSVLFSVSDMFTQAIRVSFTRYSDWFDDTQSAPAATAITSTGQTFVLNNPGSLPVQLLTMRLRSNTAAGFTNPVVTNLSNSYVFGTLRDATSSSDEVKLDTSVPSVEYSANDGGVYVDDYANYAAYGLPTDHGPLAFVLEPGDNTIQVVSGGTVNLNIEFTFYPVFA